MSFRIPFVVFVLILLIPGTLQQRGGGGRSGGSSSRGGYFRGLGGSQCVGDCDKIVGIIMGGLIGTTCCIGCCSCCCNCSKSGRAVSNLEKKYRKMKIQDLHEEEFTAHLNAFSNLIESVRQYKGRFRFKQGYNENLITFSKVETQRKDNYECKVSLRGNDFLGVWDGKGGFIQTEEGPFFWMFKEYDNKDEAGQTGDWHTLVYESRYIKGDRAEGVWFYYGFENSTQYAGQWSIIGENTNLNNHASPFEVNDNPYNRF